jgi:hypothetical protein
VTVASAVASSHFVAGDERGNTPVCFEVLSYVGCSPPGRDPQSSRHRSPPLRPQHRVLDDVEACAVWLIMSGGTRCTAPIVRRVLTRLVGWPYDGSGPVRARLVGQLPMVGFRPLNQTRFTVTALIRGACIAGTTPAPTGAHRRDRERYQQPPSLDPALHQDREHRQRKQCQRHRRQAQATAT